MAKQTTKANSGTLQENRTLRTIHDCLTYQEYTALVADKYFTARWYDRMRNGSYRLPHTNINVALYHWKVSEGPDYNNNKSVFMTLTFHPTFHKQNTRQLCKITTLQLIRWMKYIKHPQWRFVPELMENGVLHYHVLFGDYTSKEIEFKRGRFRQWWAKTNGRYDIQRNWWFGYIIYMRKQNKLMEEITGTYARTVIMSNLIYRNHLTALRRAEIKNKKKERFNMLSKLLIEI